MDSGLGYDRMFLFVLQRVVLPLLSPCLSDGACGGSLQ